MQERIVMGRVESYSGCIPLILFGIGEQDVVADQVIVGTIYKSNTVKAVVIGGVPTDGGIGGASQVDALTGGAGHRAAGVADMVVRDGDVVRAGYVNATVSCTGNSEAINGDITFAGDAEGTATTFLAITGYDDTRGSSICDGQAITA